MKKQILFLALFVAAILVGNNAFGQSIADGDPDPYVTFFGTGVTPACVGATPIDATCVATPDPLHPQTGFTYTYDVTVSNPGGDKIHWLVTDETNVIVALNNMTGTTIDPVNGTYVLNAGVEYNDPTQTDNTIDISWKAFDASTVVLLVVYVIDEEGCTDNIEVYRIEPTFRFTLDIAALSEVDGSINGVAGSSTAEECVSPVESAVYDASLNSGEGGLTVDYGENWLFFTVNAANFSHSWMPTFELTYTGTPFADPEVSWAYPADANAGTGWKTTTLAAGIYTSDEPALATGTTLGTPDVVGEVGDAGECIIVRVRIDHGTDELAEPTGSVLTLAVDGIMYDAGNDVYTTATLGDLHYTDGTNTPTEDCPWTDGYANDWVNYTLTPRPEVTTATVGVAPNPNPAPFELKN